FSQIGRERKLAAHVGRHFGVLVVGAGDIDLVLDQRLVAHDLAAEHKGVAGDQPLDEIFLDLAQRPAAAAAHAGGAGAPAATAHQLYLQHGLFDDGADVETIALPYLWIGDAPAP